MRTLVTALLILLPAVVVGQDGFGLGTQLSTGPVADGALYGGVTPSLAFAFGERPLSLELSMGSAIVPDPYYGGTSASYSGIVNGATFTVLGLYLILRGECRPGDDCGGTGVLAVLAPALFSGVQVNYNALRPRQPSGQGLLAGPFASYRTDFFVREEGAWVRFDPAVGFRVFMDLGASSAPAPPDWRESVAVEVGLRAPVDYARSAFDWRPPHLFVSAKLMLNPPTSSASEDTHSP